MEWKKKLYVIGAVLLCTSLLVASNTPPQNVDKATTIAVHQASSQAPGAPRLAANPQSVPTLPVGPLDDIAKPLDNGPALTPEEQQKLARGEQKPPTQEELEQQKLLDEYGGRVQWEEPASLQTAQPIAPEEQIEPLGLQEPRDGEPRADCVGDIILGTGTSTSVNAPLRPWYVYARSVSILLRSEFTTCDTSVVTKVAVYVGTACTSSVPNVKIWLKKTTATTAPTTWDVSGATQVYGPTTVTFSPAGWMVFDITDFTWNSDNLQIMWEDSGADVCNSTTPAFRYTSTSPNYRTTYGYSDSAPPTALSTTYNRPNYTLTFAAIPAFGACCDPAAMTCTPNVAPGDCLPPLVYQGNGSSCTPNPCIGACCYNYPNVLCANTPDAATCTSLYGGIWHAGSDCNAGYICPPWNDNCSAVTPETLTPSVPVTFTGDTRGATNDPGTCSFSNPQVWHAITLPPSFAYWDVTLDYCGTVGFSNSYLNFTTACPCSGVTAGGTYDSASCTPPDTNITIRWKGLAAGTYYYPVLSNATQAWGPYTIHVVAVPAYCGACYTNTTDEYITNVLLNTINNTSGQNGSCSYGDYTSVSTDLRQGTTYPITVAIYSSYTNYTKVWIDWNQNKSFTDAGEEYTLGSHTGSTPFTGSIPVPITASLGATRMRVKIQESSYPTPCNSATYGELEDYTINVLEALPTGACCFGLDDCQDSGTWNVETCTTAGGYYAGNGSTCTPNPCKGACCFLNGSCLEVKDAAACTAAGGNSFSGVGTSCSPNLCPQPGDECSNPAVISALPYTTVFNNATATSGPPSCNSSYTVTMNDWWFVYAPAVDQCVTLDVSDVAPGYDMVMGIYTGPDCNNLTLIPSQCYDDPEPYHVTLSVTAGTMYWFHIGKYGSSAGGGPTNFSLVECPKGACCNGETCAVVYQTACTSPGIFMGAGSTCSPNPCLTRACCFYPSGDCLNLSEGDCQTQGGTWDGTQTCSTKTCPTPGNNCNQPRDFTLPANLPYTDVNTTCGRLHDYDGNTCLGYYDGGEDMIYRITVTEDVCVNVALTSNSTWVGLAIDDSCPLDPTTCLYKATSSGSGVTLSNVSLLASVGTYYLMIDQFSTPDCIPSFTLSFTACPTGACCVGSTCSVVSQAICTSMGGLYQGNDTTCSPTNPCLVGACCTYGATPACTDTDEAGCTALGGIYHASLSCASFTCPPPNDDCAHAIVVADGTPAATGDNCAATDDGAASCQSNSHKSLWYKWTAPSCPGTASMSTEGSSQSDTVLSVYSDCIGTQVACDDDSGTGNLSLLSFTYVANADYYIRVASYSTGCGGFNLNISHACTPQGACCMPDGTCHLDYQTTCTGSFGGADTACAGADCNGNNVDDFCDVHGGGIPDCNHNGIPDSCDIANGMVDADLNGVPDVCQPDCNNNGILDLCEVVANPNPPPVYGCALGNCGTLYPSNCGLLPDCQPDGIPDSCQLGDKAARAELVCQHGITGDTGVGSGELLATGSDSVQGFTGADDFTLASAATVTGLTWQAVYYNNASDCPGNDGIEIRIYSDSSGAPGAVLQTYPNVTHTKALASRPPIFGTNPVYDFSGTLDPAFSAQAGVKYWVAIIGDPSVGGCAGTYGWLASPEVPPGNAVYYQNSGSGWVSGDADLAFCVIGSGGGGPTGGDCNGNLIPDDCDIRDCHISGHPEWCDCNNNGKPDSCEIAGHDCNNNGILDSCDLANCTGQPWCSDCNGNGILDFCDIANCPAGQHACADCQGDGIPDGCQLGTGGGGGAIIDEGFADITTLTAAGWNMQNLSSPLGTSNWFQGNGSVFTSQAGPANSYIGANFNNTGDPGTISNWLLTPAVTLENGLVLDFYTRSPTCGTTCWADRLQVRMSLNGTSTNVGATATSEGDFTTLLLDVNPTLQPYGYPETWDTGHYTLTLSGIATPTQGRVAFRYFVEGAGYNYGANGDYIGIDTVKLLGTPTPPSNDCNNNGIPDECDIGTAWGGHCTGTGCSSDYNGNGVPDECELCGDFTGIHPGYPADAPNGVVDTNDWQYIHDGMGCCNAYGGWSQANYVNHQLADMDHDGCITQVDYQSWVMCYRMANKKEFVPPTPPPAEGTIKLPQAQNQNPVTRAPRK